MFAWYHWLAVAAPACAVCALAFSCRRYVRSVSDFLVAGRCAGRFFIYLLGIPHAFSVFGVRLRTFPVLLAACLALALAVILAGGRISLLVTDAVQGLVSYPVFVAVGCCFWLGSCLFEQLDYINMFVTIACSMWFTGAGAVVTLGLYWRRGTAAGAYAALLSAAAISLCGVFVQRGWAATVLPWLAAHGLDGAVRHALEAASAPFDPWIRWTVSDAEWAVKFPVNSVELSFFAMLVALLLYVAVPVALGLLTSVWFSWGTARDLRRLFRDLETRVRDDRDNGMVEKDAPKAPRPAAGRGS